MGAERGGSRSVGGCLGSGFGGYRLWPAWAEGDRRIPRLPAVPRALSSSMTPSPAPPQSISPQARVGAQTPGQHPPPKLRAARLSEQGPLGQSSQAGAEVGTESPRPLLRGWPGLHGCHVPRCPVGTRGPGTRPHTAPQKGPEQRGLRSLYPEGMLRPRPPRGRAADPSALGGALALVSSSSRWRR